VRLGVRLQLRDLREEIDRLGIPFLGYRRRLFPLFDLHRGGRRLLDGDEAEQELRLVGVLAPIVDGREDGLRGRVILLGEQRLAPGVGEQGRRGGRRLIDRGDDFREELLVSLAHRDVDEPRERLG